MAARICGEPRRAHKFAGGDRAWGYEGPARDGPPRTGWCETPWRPSGGRPPEKEGVIWRSEEHAGGNGPRRRGEVEEVKGRASWCRGEAPRLGRRRAHVSDHRTTAAGGCHAGERLGVGGRRRACVEGVGRAAVAAGSIWGRGRQRGAVWPSGSRRWRRVTVVRGRGSSVCRGRMADECRGGGLGTGEAMNGVRWSESRPTGPAGGAGDQEDAGSVAEDIVRSRSLARRDVWIMLLRENEAYRSTCRQFVRARATRVDCAAWAWSREGGWSVGVQMRPSVEAGTLGQTTWTW